MPRYLLWLNPDLRDVGFKNRGMKTIHRLDEKPILIKELPSWVDKDFAKENLDYFRSRIPYNIPETSLAYAPDEMGVAHMWEIQEEIRGENLAEQPLWKKPLKWLRLTKMWREYYRISSLHRVDKYEGNFIWDKERNKLFYIDLIGGIPACAGD
jgi:hypothetical protein